MRRLVFIALILLIPQAAMAESAPDWNRLADAIHVTENGHKLDKGEAYGIHSVHYRDAKEARVICIRTCRHAWKDHKGDYLTFLAKRYCPGNWKVWRRNVAFFMASE